jgi:glutamyl-tRNA synthetase
MTIITRFAPSPTGQLHIGNVRTALHNYLWAKRNKGRFMLRIDDTDAERSREEFVEGIRSDLAWLGLNPDGEVRQSERFALYEAAFEKLRAGGHAYACYETPEELEVRRKVLLGRGLPPVYERKPADTPVPAGVAPHWRFRLNHDAPITWDDLVRGPQSFDPKLLSDPVIRRADGSWLYMLPSAIDDVDMAITHVVRGEDHVTNTALQIQMFAAMGAAPPAFAHAALLTGVEGKLSKRLGSLGMDAFQSQGIEPIAIGAMLARLGTSDPVEPATSLDPLIATVDFTRFGRAPARFDDADLATLNAKILHVMPFDAVATRLPYGMNASAWDAIRPNISTLADVAEYWAVVEGPIAAHVDNGDIEYVAVARDIIATLDFTDNPWGALTSQLKVDTGRSGKALFLPLRRALTGMDHGPDMGALLPLIGRDAALARLTAAYKAAA